MKRLLLLLQPAKLSAAVGRAARALREGGPRGLRRWLGRDSGLGSSVSYTEWLTRFDPGGAAALAGFRVRASLLRAPPLFTLLLRAGDDAAQLARAIAAVRGQALARWELLVLLDEGTKAAVAAAAEAEADTDTDTDTDADADADADTDAAVGSLRLVRTAPGLPWEAGLAAARGEWVALLEPSAELAPQALLLAADALARAPAAALPSLIYGDHDRLDAEGRRRDPFFKPGFDPELLWSLDLLAPFCLVRTGLARAAGAPAGPPAASRYGLHLRVLRSAGMVGAPTDPASAEPPSPEAAALHLPAVLCHVRGKAPLTGAEESAAQAALQEHLALALPGALVMPGRFPGTRRVRPPLPAQRPLVSALVPTRDGVRVLRKCVQGLLERTDWPQLEVIVIDNGSRDPETLAYLASASLQADGRVRVLRDDGPFNFSTLNNRAARVARGELLLLLNDDVEPIEPGWLAELAGHALRPEIGAVGARLLYPDGRVQHAGVATGVLGLAAHLMRGLPGDAPGPNGLAQVLRGSTVVTAACLAVRRELYLRAGGLDETLAVAFNDVDLCLRLAALGYRNLVTPHAELLHHESWSRGSDQVPARRERFAGELLTMLLRWPHLSADPLYNPNLTLASDQLEPGSPPRTK